MPLMYPPSSCRRTHGRRGHHRAPHQARAPVRRRLACLLMAAQVAVPVRALAQPPDGAPARLEAIAAGASGVATGTAVDAVAERAFWASAHEGGTEVGAPVAGQEVFALFEFNLAGPPGLMDVAVRATLDGAPLCSRTLSIVTGVGFNTWCDDPWRATAGAHTLRWEIDAGDLIDETDEENNSATKDVFVGAGASPTPSATPAPTPPSPTRTRTRSPDATPTAAPPPSPTASAALASPSPSRSAVPTATVPAQESPTPDDGGDAFARGDADCSLTRTAADVVAQAVALGGGSRCGNDDCDRDGAIGDADRRCAVGCLFDACPVPEHAPQVTSVILETTARIVPVSLVRIRGTGFTASDRLTTVKIGGVATTIIETVEDGELLVVVPNLPPGPADIVVFAGDLAGFPFPIQIAAPDAAAVAGVSATGGLAELLARVDEVAVRFLALDLSVFYDEENIPLVRDAVENFRAALARLDVDALLTPEQRAEADRLVNGSGILGLVRDVITELATLGATSRAAPQTAGGPAVLTRVARVVSGGLAVTRIAVAGAATASAGTSVLALAAGATVIAATLGAAVVGLPKAADALFAPVMSGIEFGRLPDRDFALPRAFANARVFGARLHSRSTKLVVTTSYMRRALPPAEECGPGCLVYVLPETSGFCGRVTFHLEDGRFASAAIGSSVQPEVVSLRPPDADYSTTLNLRVRGVAPAVDACDAKVRFEGPVPAVTRHAPYDRPTFEVGSGGTTFQVRPRTSVEASPFARELPPGGYVARVEVEGESSVEEASAEEASFRFRSLVTGVDIRCDHTELVLRPAMPSTATCCFGALSDPLAPLPHQLFPVDTRIEVGPDGDAIDVSAFFVDTDVADSTGFCAPLPAIEVSARRLGSATLGARAVSAGDLLAESATGVTFTVEDGTAPTLRVINLDCRDFISVSPGETVEIVAVAVDALGVSRVRLEATGDAAANPVQEFPCVFDPTEPETICEADFRLTFRTAGFTEPEVFTILEAFDSSGNASDKVQCSFRVEGPPLPPPRVELFKIAGTDTRVPGGDGATFRFFSEYAVSGGTVVFIGGEGSQDGIYAGTGTGPPELVAERNTTLVPRGGGPRTFGGFRNLSVDGRNVVFNGGGTSDRALYRIALGADPVSGVERLVELPRGAPAFFVDLTSVTYRQAYVAARVRQGETSSNETDSVQLVRVPSDPADVTLIADVNTPIPMGTGTFEEFPHGFRPVVLDVTTGPVVAFLGRGSDEQWGIYRDRGSGPPEVVAHTATRVPGTDLTFTQFCTLAIDGESVAFTGAYLDGRAPRRGIYALRGTTPETVVEPTTRIPDSQQQFGNVACGPIAADAGVIAFESGLTRLGGVYAQVPGGEIIKIVAQGDRVDGKVASGAHLYNDDSVDGLDLAVVVEFEDGSRALYRARLLTE